MKPCEIFFLQMFFGKIIKVKTFSLKVVKNSGCSKCSGRPIFNFFILKKIELKFSIYWRNPWWKTSSFVQWDMLLSQTLIYYWQEIFLLILVPESEAILQWYHCIICWLNGTIERLVNLNVTWLDFAFVLI